jgi:hypothetical protein
MLHAGPAKVGGLLKLTLRLFLVACLLVCALNVYVFAQSEQATLSKLLLPLLFGLYCSYYFVCRLSARNAHLGIGIVTRGDTEKLVFNDLIALVLPIVFLIGHVMVRR